MSVISVFGALFCRGTEVSKMLSDSLGYQVIEDTEIIEHASNASGLSAQKIEKALKGKVSVFNRFTHERERAVAYFKASVADRLSDDGLVFLGYSGHVIPASITHVLKICLIADEAYQIETAVERQIDKDSATRMIEEDRQRRSEWTEYLLHREPWNPRLYDMVLPMNTYDLEQVVQLIVENAGKRVVQPSLKSLKAVKDFVLQSQVEVALAREGHSLQVSADDGQITITINTHVIMLNRLEEELGKIARTVPGVTSVETRVGPDFYQTDIYRRYDFKTPSKVLLVDDEPDFVETLSERLQMRDVGSAVAYNGEEALSVVENDEPEVMILDLRMPGIDGIEVLKRVKEGHPEIEVIILTGHGSREDEKTCMDLGAFAYLQKPVDLELLTTTMNQAYEKIRERHARGKEEEDDEREETTR
jgi:CheY-like chemotaxis protein